MAKVVSFFWFRESTFWGKAIDKRLSGGVVVFFCLLVLLILMVLCLFILFSFVVFFGVEINSFCLVFFKFMFFFFRPSNPRIGFVFRVRFFCLFVFFLLVSFFLPKRRLITSSVSAMYSK